MSHVCDKTKDMDSSYSGNQTNNLKIKSGNSQRDSKSIHVQGSPRKTMGYNYDNKSQIKANYHWKWVEGSNNVILKTNSTAVM